jgi:hypothetical protein
LHLESNGRRGQERLRRQNSELGTWKKKGRDAKKKMKMKMFFSSSS